MKRSSFAPKIKVVRVDIFLSLGKSHWNSTTESHLLLRRKEAGRNEPCSGLESH